MTLLKTIAITLALFGGGLALANNFQDDPICADPGHNGYQYDPLVGGSPLPPLPFNPSAPMPAGVTNVGQFGTDFDCDNPNTLKECHYVYIPASGSEPAKWIKCEVGSYNDLRTN